MPPPNPTYLIVRLDQRDVAAVRRRLHQFRPVADVVLSPLGGFGSTPEDYASVRALFDSVLGRARELAGWVHR